MKHYLDFEILKFFPIIAVLWNVWWFYTYFIGEQMYTVWSSMICPGLNNQWVRFSFKTRSFYSKSSALSTHYIFWNQEGGKNNSYFRNESREPMLGVGIVRYAITRKVKVNWSILTYIVKHSMNFLFRILILILILLFFSASG